MATLNDIVLVNVDNKPGFYARIDDIKPDVKPGWWQVSLLVFTFPLQVFNWILDENQIEGADFTMGGTPMRLDPVVSPILVEQQLREQQEKELEQQQNLNSSSGSKVVSLAERRKK